MAAGELARQDLSVWDMQLQADLCSRAEQAWTRGGQLLTGLGARRGGL